MLVFALVILPFSLLFASYRFPIARNGWRRVYIKTIGLIKQKKQREICFKRNSDNKYYTTEFQA
jgi:hypothetical protein